MEAIEINATHYRLQSVETFRRWRDQTPPGFRFAPEAHRYLTHNRKLDDPLPAIRLERDRAAGLGEKPAAVLWQLPSNFHRNLGRLEGFARALRALRRPRHAIEFRHPSWFDEEVAACLRAHRPREAKRVMYWSSTGTICPGGLCAKATAAAIPGTRRKPAVLTVRNGCAGGRRKMVSALVRPEGRRVVEADYRETH